MITRTRTRSNPALKIADAIAHTRIRYSDNRDDTNEYALVGVFSISDEPADRRIQNDPRTAN